ncbi:MAG: histidine phosphatase family protein [Ignavibacteriaceae bacterium]|jgi:phosphohistidine phosphatase|nr:histidine phosphatase family protein [Ignavibacteriaceae bacterium]MCU0405880.1 histidine phosphatase family protein [Ignavibacteriaceae bacterium]
MKTLYLARHAKSYWKDQSIPDFDRPLNSRGKRDAPFMGEVLNDKKIKPDLIVSSPAKRTKKTAIEIASKLGYTEKKIQFNEDLYEASSNTIIKLIKKIEEKYDRVMIFGHNPGLTMLNNHISNHYIDNIPTCGIVALQFDKKWSEIDKNSCKFLFFEYPKLYL